MKKFLIILAVLSIPLASIPQAQAGISTSKSYKLSVTIPESVQQVQANPQELLSAVANIPNPTESPVVSPAAFSQGFQLVETVRDNQPIVLITYVVQ